MKNVAALAGVGVLMFIAFPPFVQAASPQRMEWQGVVQLDELCLAEPCAGQLVTCDEGSIRISLRLKDTYLEGVCDDGDATSACAGRLTEFFEACRPANGSVTVGSVSASSFRGRGRTCFDPDGVSDCTDPLASNVVVIREYTVRVRTRGVVKPSASDETLHFPDQGTARVVPTASSSFTIDGKTTELENASTSFWTGQADDILTGCAEVNELLGQPPGCGIAGVDLFEQTRCCADCNGDGEVRVDELVTGVNNALEGCTE